MLLHFKGLKMEGNDGVTVAKGCGWTEAPDPPISSDFKEFNGEFVIVAFQCLH